MKNKLQTSAHDLVNRWDQKLYVLPKAQIRTIVGGVSSKVMNYRTKRERIWLMDGNSYAFGQITKLVDASVTEVINAKDQRVQDAQVQCQHLLLASCEAERKNEVKAGHMLRCLYYLGMAATSVSNYVAVKSIKKALIHAVLSGVAADKLNAMLMLVFD